MNNKILAAMLWSCSLSALVHAEHGAPHHRKVEFQKCQPKGRCKMPYLEMLWMVREYESMVGCRPD